MNGYQRIHAALNGAWPDSRPVMLHNFMHAARESGVTMSAFRACPSVIARCFIQSVERYGYDGIVVDIDTATLAGALGVPVHLPVDEPAICHGHRLLSLDAVGELPPPDIARDPRVQIWLEAVRLLKAHFHDEIFLRGNCDQAPFSLACSLRGLAGWLMDIMDPAQQQNAHRLLEYATAATTQFVRLMASAGAHMISNGDSSAGPSVVSPRIFRQFALPYEMRVASAARELALPYLLHICGKTEPILEDLVSTGATALELDHKTDCHSANAIIAGRCTFTGNIDPSRVLALGAPQDVELATRALLRAFSATPRFILNAGCAIPATTPSQNIRAMIRTARAWSKE